MVSTTSTPAINKIAAEIKVLHDRDEALSKARAKTKVEQRDVRLRIGELVGKVPAEHLPAVAQRSGYSVARLKDFAFVRRAWPAGSFPDDLSYTPLEELAHNEDRFTLVKAGMSKRDARQAKGGRVDTPSRWSPQVKSDFVKEALADPEVARQVANDQASRAAMAEAEWEHRRGARAQREAAHPEMGQQRVRTEFAELSRDLDNIRYAVARATDKAITLQAAGRSDLIEGLEEVKNAVGWLESYLTSGGTTFESELHSLLEGP